MKLNYNKIRVVFLMPVLLLASIGHSATLFTETFGTPASTTAFGSYTGYSSGLTFSGSGDVRTSTASSVYAGASGSGNAFLTSSGTALLTISGINTSGLQAGTLDLSFGAYKSTTASDLTDVTLEWQVTGDSTWNTLTFSAQATGTGTTGWRLISITGSSIGISSDISLRFSNTSITNQARLDDITLSGVSAVPEPSVYAAIAGGFALCGALMQRRRKSVAKAV